jgi:hypothetical protein
MKRRLLILGLAMGLGLILLFGYQSIQANSLQPLASPVLTVPQELPSKYGFIDQTGQMVIPLTFDEAYHVSEGLALVRQGERRGYIDRQGQWVVQPKFYSSSEFSDGLATVSLPNGRYGFIDTTGTVVLKLPKGWYAGPFWQGLAIARNSSYQLYIDRTGKLAIPAEFYSAGAFSQGIARVEAEQTFGYINKMGQYIAKPQFGIFSQDFAEGLAMVEVP